VKSRFHILFKYIARYRIGYLIGFIGLIATDIFMLLRPQVVGNAIDSLGKHIPEHPLHWYIGIFLILVVLENLFRVLWRLSLMGSSRRIERDFLNDFFAHLLKLDPSFYDRTPTGDLMARATNDIASIRMLLGPGMMALFDAVVVSGLTLFFMISLSPRLTFYAMMPIPFLGLLLGFILKKVHHNYDKVQAQFAAISATAQESISGIRVIKAHNREDIEIKAFDDVTSDYVRKYMRLTRFESAIEPVIIFLAGLGVLITLFVGGKAVMSGELTLGQLVQFFLYLMTFVWPVIAIGWAANLWQRGLASLKRVQAILNEQPTIAISSSLHQNVEDVAGSSEGKSADASEPGETSFVSGDIELRNVSFRYKPEGPDVLTNITLTIKEGTTVGIVGPMGSGKTTLLNLIARLYDPTEGEILIGGKNIKHIPVQELRRQIAFVPQEPFLFSRTIEENINLGRSDAPLGEQEIIHALKLADLMKDVESFPARLHTSVGERGVALSGGQKQRMSIARAFARDTSIVILDDTLSSVDTHTEERIIKNLKAFTRKRTNIIVSHRISSVKDADHIVVLMDGKIIEQGTHNELLNLNGFYAKLYHQQLLHRKLEEM